MNFKGIVMNSKVSVQLDLTLTGGVTRLSLNITKYVTKDGAPARCYTGLGFDPQWQTLETVYWGETRASSLAGLAQWVRTNLVGILVVLEENGTVHTHGSTNPEYWEPVVSSAHHWFNTGNDFKLVTGFLDFFGEIRTSESQS
jgi:hypothetical protein